MRSEQKRPGLYRGGQKLIVVAGSRETLPYGEEREVTAERDPRRRKEFGMNNGFLAAVDPFGTLYLGRATQATIDALADEGYRQVSDLYVPHSQVPVKGKEFLDYHQ